ncbi:hypothetical protein [Sinomonas soli]
MDLAAIAAELYTLAPGAFTAARNERAKLLRREGQRELAQQVARLAKPTVSAWAVNALAGRRAEALARVVTLGAQLQEAQEDLDAARLRSLAKERAQLLAEAVAAARGAADESGIAMSDAAAAEIEQTLRAAMADAQASAAVQSGLLLHALEGNGIDPVDLSDAVAVPGALDRPTLAGDVPRAAGSGHRDSGGRPADGRRPRKAADRRRTKDADRQQEADRHAEEERRADELRREERAEAEADRDDAAQALDEAQAELAGAERDAADAAARAHRLADELAGLRARITELEDDLAAAEREGAAAERARRLAARLVERELRAVSRAQERLAGLG